MFSSLLQISGVPFRLDDSLALTIIAVSIFGCVAHFFREIIYGRRGQRWNMVFEQIERYDKIQIVIHWLFLALLLGLFITGVFIYKMDYFSNVSPQIASVGLRNWVAYHWYFSIAVINLGIFHIVYDSLIIRKFREAWVSRLDIANMKAIIQNFTARTKEYPRLEKLHPMQKMFHWAIFVDIFLLGFTGLTIWEPFQGFIQASGLDAFNDWLYIFKSRFLHDILTFTLVGLIIGHFYFSTLIPTNWKVFRGIIYGRLKIEEEAEQKKQAEQTSKQQ
ncbi:MAG: cytochrome b/b6 domain-containing protein [Thaumarchaeota archaeon]|nr:cytochrome b/b6 domain-containing protein [Nitrososphaerota archaeon]MCL5316887.1 cytochrome b/b6 domain-containing protein [Nitrososphaerota archaeon]